MTISLILASKSKSRQQLLHNAGISFSAQPVFLDEREIEARFLSRAKGVRDVKDIASHLATEKALAASNQTPNAVIIGADQMLSFEGNIMHKPASREEAKQQLLAFRGKTHHLYAAISLVRDGQVLDVALEQAQMTMRNFSERECEHILDLMGEEYLYCVGAYNLEGPAIQLFEKVEGDYFTILGLPMLPLLSGLRKAGVL